jgi:hypothetical protein
MGPHQHFTDEIQGAVSGTILRWAERSKRVYVDVA